MPKSTYRHQMQILYLMFAIVKVYIGWLNPSNFLIFPGRCYTFAPGQTIAGADYRRDYDVDKKACAETCRLEACCMAFEWREEDGMCTLKSRSLNGTVSQSPHADTHFGLCLDYGEIA